MGLCGKDSDIIRARQVRAAQQAARATSQVLQCGQQAGGARAAKSR